MQRPGHFLRSQARTQGSHFADSTHCYAEKQFINSALFFCEFFCYVSYIYAIIRPENKWIKGEKLN